MQIVLTPMGLSFASAIRGTKHVAYPVGMLTNACNPIRAIHLPCVRILMDLLRVPAMRDTQVMK